jgi:hypothetical protein
MQRGQVCYSSEYNCDAPKFGLPASQELQHHPIQEFFNEEPTPFDYFMHERGSRFSVQEISVALMKVFHLIKSAGF